MARRPRTARLAGVDDDELVARAQAGNALAEHVLLERHRRIALARRRRSFLVGGDREDVEQEALIGLAKAIRAYRAGGPASFRTFAEVCVDRQLATAIKAATRHKHQALNRYVSISAPDGGPGGGAGRSSLDDLLVRCHEPDLGDRVVEAEGAAALRATVGALLSSLEAEVLWAHLEGWSYQELAERLDRSTKSVDNALQRARRKVGGHLAGGSGGRSTLAS